MKKKSRKTILKKREKKLDTIGYSKLDIMWFFQWLKLAVDMEGQSLSFTKSNWVTGSQNKQVRKPTTKSFKITVGGIGLSAINLNELKRLPKIMNMTKREIFQHFNKWFAKNKHLFGDFSVQFVQNKNNMINSDDYFTVQIPKSLDRRTIDNQIDTLMKGLKLKTPGGKKRDITFNRGVQKDVMKKQWEVYKLKTIDKLENSKIAKRVGYKSGSMLNITGGKKQTQGVRAVQKSFESAKYLVINVSNGIFPKTTL